jgi:hypothetical protein
MRWVPDASLEKHAMEVSDVSRPQCVHAVQGEGRTNWPHIQADLHVPSWCSELAEMMC